MSSVITFSNLSAATPDGRVLFDDLSLSVGTERVGLVGRNGSGKSTLLHIATGTIAALSGRVHRVGTVGTLVQNWRDEDTIAEAFGIAERLATLVRIEIGDGAADDFDAADWNLPATVEAALAEVGLAGINLARRMSSLSGGERTRIGIARLLLEHPDLLLLDEPSNNLDSEGRAAIEQLIAGWRGGVLVASHDRALLERMDRIVELSPVGIQSGDSAQRRRRPPSRAVRARLSIEVRGLTQRSMVRLPLIAVSVLVATLPTQVRADELQRCLVAGAQATNTADHAFRQTITASGTGVDNSSKTYVTTYDPRRVSDERWRLVSIDGRSATPEELQKWRKAKRASVPTYADLAKWLGTPATRTDGPGGTVIYRYPRLPAGTLKLGSHDASSNTAAEVQVNPGAGAPYVERVRFTSTKGFRMMLVASVRSMVFVSRYRRLPGGEIVPTDVTSNIAGAMMGKSGELRTTVGYAAWQKVR